MFLYYFVHVEAPFSAVEEQLRSGGGGLDRMAAEAYRDGESIRARIGPGNEHPLLAKSVRITLGTPRDGDCETTFPIVWEATGVPALFPRLDGDLVVTSLGRTLTQVTLRGSYEPPMGAVGRALDRTVLHRVAEASVKGFLDRLARTLGMPVAMNG
jgi:hypothetical protein